MALDPKIFIDIINNCNKVDVWESTGVYDVTNNPGGWGTPNINPSDVTTSYVKVYDYTGVTLLQTITLKETPIDLYPAVVNSNTFKIATNNTWTQATDGVFKIIYTITDSLSNVYNSSGQYELMICNLEYCMDKLIAKLVDICDEEKLKRYKETLDQLEILKYGIKTAFASGDFATATSLISDANTLCTTFSDCGCGCNDCN